MKTDRRGFLRQAAALAVAPAIVPASVRATPSPNEKIQVGLIGVGGQGRHHAITLSRDFQHEARVVAVCDVNAASTAAAKEMVDGIYEQQDCTVHRDFRELLARDDIDAVAVSVPDHWHALIGVAAAAAGKHLYSEKAFAYTVDEGRAMLDAVKRAGIVFQHGTQQRSDTNYWRACMLARNGRLGMLRTVRVGSPFGERGGSTEPVAPPEGLDYDFWLGPAPYHPYTDHRCDGRGGKGWYHIRDYSGGWITAWGSHDVDIAHWGIGADDGGPLAVEGWYECPDQGVYDTAWRWRFELKYPGGVTLVYASEDENPHGVRFEGDEGWVFVNRGVLEAEPESLLTVDLDADPVQLARSENHHANWLTCIRSGAHPVSTAEAAHRSTNACHLCNIAGALKRGVRWDAAAECIPGDAVANHLLSRPMRTPWRL